MPRKLPWASTTPSAQPPAKRQRTSYHDAGPQPPLAPAPPAISSSDNNPDGSSDDTTPTYMLPSDEHYIMVEDEFLAIAQTYTRSVHRAEYERLQLLATSKNASRISEIQRPVTGMTRMSREILAKRRAREDVLRGLPPVRGGDSSSDEEDGAARSVWGGSSLGLLMCRPKERERDLSARWKIATATRAAAGFVKARVDTRGRLAGEGASIKPEQPKQEATASDTNSSDEDGGEDDDDLDAPIIASRPPSQILPRSSPSRSALPSRACSTLPPSCPAFPPRSSSQPLPRLTRHPTAPLSRPHSSQPAPPSSSPIPIKKPPDFDFNFGLATSRSTSTYRGRSMAARKQAERQPSPPRASAAKREGLLGRLFPVRE